MVVQPCQKATAQAVESLVRILARDHNAGWSCETQLRGDITWLLHMRDNVEVDEVGDTDQIGALFEVLQYIAVIILPLQLYLYFIVT